MSAENSVVGGVGDGSPRDDAKIAPAVRRDSVLDDIGRVLGLGPNVQLVSVLSRCGEAVVANEQQPEFRVDLIGAEGYLVGKATSLAQLKAQAEREGSNERIIERDDSRFGKIIEWVRGSHAASATTPESAAQPEIAPTATEGSAR